MTTHIFKFMIGIIILMNISFTVSAQDDDFKNSTPEERAEFQTEWMKSELSLDSLVVPAVYNINLKYSKKMQSIMISGGSKIQKYREYKASSGAKDSELKKLFTKEQYEVYLQNKEEMKQKMKERIREKRKNG